MGCIKGDETEDYVHYPISYHVPPTAISRHATTVSKWVLQFVYVYSFSHVCYGSTNF